MVKPSSNRMEPRQVEPHSSSSSDKKYKGVRKRKWGKYVSEIRLPNCRERIWLGSYDTAEKAARAFDAALYCLRGDAASFNFPDDPPRIENGRSMSPAEIQEAAARFAKSGAGGGVGDHSGRVDNGSDTTSEASDLLLHHTDSPCCASVSSSVQQLDFEIPDMPLDQWFLDQFLTLDTGDNNATDLGIFPEFNGYNNWDESHFEELNTVAGEAGSFLWNFQL